MRPAPPLRQKRWHLVAAIALGAAAALASAPAFAQPSGDLAQLRQVFAEGRTLEGNGQWAEALDKFKEVAAAKMTPHVRFHMALCEENLGKLVSALHGFELAGAEATAAGSSAVEVAAPAKEHADALHARIARLHIELIGKLGTSRLTLDGASVAEKDLGSPIDVDPGAHVVELRDGAGKSTFRKELTLAEKGSEKLEIAASDSGPSSAPQGPATSTGGSSRAPAVVAGAIGVAALAGSGVFFVLRANNISAIAQNCTNMASYTGCNPGDADLQSTGKTYTAVADALLAVGLAGVGTGAILWFALAPKAQPSGSTPPAAASLRLVPMGTGVKIIGVF